MDLLKSLPSKRIDGTLVDHVVNIKAVKNQAGISSLFRNGGIHHGAHRRLGLQVQFRGREDHHFFPGVRLD